MSQCKHIGGVVALSIAAAITATGCLAAPSEDAERADDAAIAADQGETGEAEAAFFGGFGLSCACPRFFGAGFGGFGPLFAGCGGCGFGAPFGGCGGCF